MGNWGKTILGNVVTLACYWFPHIMGGSCFRMFATGLNAFSENSDAAVRENSGSGRKGKKRKEKRKEKRKCIFALPYFVLGMRRKGKNEGFIM